MHKAGYLLDVNVLYALAEERHAHHILVTRWFQSNTRKWGITIFTEAGYLHLASNPKIGGHSLDEAIMVLREFAKRPDFQFWPVPESWLSLTDAFSTRIFGHQQITDALLLGTAIKHNALLVTLDKAVKYLAGPQFAQHVFLLE